MTFDEKRPVLITGGAGFIGTNLAHRLLTQGQPVLLLDSLARAGAQENLHWLRRQHGMKFEVLIADVRDALLLRRAVERSCRVFHLAAQVAVTTSLEDPARDFAINAGGTLNVLEAIRTASSPPPLIYTSTNKVYGALGGLAVADDGGRYLPVDAKVRARGLGEEQPLEFHSPYGCSKGAADQYVLDYARVFGIKACVFRMSCIYGPHQRGTEDQGWVAHFALRALADQPITIYGDGRQVRDALHVDDLVDSMLVAQARIGTLSGRAFNIGGGVGNVISLIDLLNLLRRRGLDVDVRFGPWRAADQRYYASNIDAFAAATGWRPRIGVEEGVDGLLEWLRPGDATPAPVSDAEEALAAVLAGVGEPAEREPAAREPDRLAAGENAPAGGGGV
jgi:CDP-paratose 2-epimerase